VGEINSREGDNLEDTERMIYQKIIVCLLEQLRDSQQDLRDTEQQNANLRATVAMLQQKLIDR